MKKIALLGSTGSIGTSTLEVVRNLSEEPQIVSLAVKSNIELLEKQVNEFSPKKVFLFEETLRKEFHKKYPHIATYSAKDGLNALILDQEVDIIVFAMSGSYSLPFFVEAVKKGKKIALANKELLVMGGDLIQSLVKPGQILPVDSEHSALFQCLQGENQKEVRRLILTASGGPFFRKTQEELENVTLEEALNHPTWKMGGKVTIDSSTLMNKGLEVIEAHYLFNIPVEKIEVVIHPQSFVHSLVEFEDGSIKAQMSVPDMKLPIQYALTYPHRKKSAISFWDISQKMQLDFFPVKRKKFPCLDLAFRALEKKKGASCYLNACNEVLVDLFFQKKLPWKDIGNLLEKLMSFQPPLDMVNLEGILTLDKRARENTYALFSKTD